MTSKYAGGTQYDGIVLTEEVWYNAWLSSPLLSLFFNLLGLGIAIYGVVVAKGAKKAAQETKRTLKAFERSVGINKMVSLMSELKENLNRNELLKASTIADVLRIECVKIESDNKFISELNFSTNIAELIIYFGSIEKHISDGTFVMNTEAFNSKQNQIIFLNEKAKEEIRDGIRN